jgi:hypothetical protein
VRAALRAELAKHALACTNAGCAAAAVCASEWRSHQEACPFTEVQCKHNAHGCTWRGARKELHTHLEVRAGRPGGGCARCGAAAAERARTHTRRSRTRTQDCPFHALRSYLNKTNQQIHHVRTGRHGR